ncbi:peptidase M14 [Collybia nuda]|uniref:Peptidase M14 n=1 Tax=Collybia nuda TaxID=64659 RepID=A0A9P6CFT2_9AGAR|nr:peptidase M14 [Collybia nuda]
MPSKILSFFRAATVITAVLAENGQQPLNFHQNPSEQGLLRRFEINSDSGSLKRVLNVAQENGLDLWQVTPTHVDIYSPPTGPQLPQYLRGIPHTLTNITASRPHVAKPLSRASVAEWKLTSLQNTSFHDTYHPLFEIDAFILELAALHPNITHVTQLGHSGEGREMLGLTISKQGVKGAEQLSRKKKKKKKTQDPELEVRPAFVIFGAQHAREWVATATSLYIAHSLVVDASEPESLSSLLNVFDFHIVPVPNPDGYDYTWENDRYWYKTRQKLHSSKKCLGLDMNRNWGYKWKGNTDGDDEPNDACSYWYPGDRPFQAPEVNNIANWVMTLPNLVGFLDFRSYGQMLSSPYSYSCKRLPGDAEDQIEAGLGAARALMDVHGTSFAMGRLCTQLYRAPGNVVDWMYSRAKVKYSYVVHLRDTGTYGFSLPSRWIRPVGEETGSMVKYLAKFIAKKMKKDM